MGELIDRLNNISDVVIDDIRDISKKTMKQAIEDGLSRDEYIFLVHVISGRLELTMFLDAVSYNHNQKLFDEWKENGI